MANDLVIKPGRDYRGKFARGNKLSRNGGRPLGSRVKLGENFLSELAADFKKHGKQAIQKLREEDNTAYVRVVASVLQSRSEASSFSRASPTCRWVT
jgi:hypothetical protein